MTPLPSNRGQSMTPRIYRLPEVKSRTGLARSTIYLRIEQGRFPRPVALGSPHVVGWVADEIDEWIHAQIRAARGESKELSPTAA